MREYKYELYKASDLVGHISLTMFITDIVPASFTIVRKDLLPEIFVTGVSNGHAPEEVLYSWLKTRLPDMGPAGPIQDEKIVEILGVSRKIMNVGRLSGLINLIGLLHHYEMPEDDYKVIPAAPTAISFLCISGWDRIFIDTAEGSRCI